MALRARYPSMMSAPRPIEPKPSALPATRLEIQSSSGNCLQIVALGPPEMMCFTVLQPSASLADCISGYNGLQSHVLYSFRMCRRVAQLVKALQELIALTMFLWHSPALDIENHYAADRCG